jgi:hypothetical protein
MIQVIGIKNCINFLDSTAKTTSSIDNCPLQGGNYTDIK